MNATAAEIAVEPPYRLDLTVAVLRRFSTNVVDVLEPDGTYLRALGGFATPVVTAVRQVAADKLAVELRGAAGEAPRALALVRRMLGTEHRPVAFYAGAAQIPWLRALAERMRGVRAPRYPSLWEACVNAVVFQQVSLYSASAILRRAILALGEAVALAASELRVFPDAATVARASDATLRAAGLSAAKVATLRRVADVLASGALDEAMLEERSSPEAVALLCRIKGIGPWTATVILLRGLGRLDVFPANDSGIARGLATFGDGTVDIANTLDILGAERGLLYFHLLLARLEAAGQLEHGGVF